jgi:ribosomal protein S18 acetylase RimI-like enzyme
LKKKLSILNISESSFNIKTNKKGILLYNFCVHKNYRGKHYGSKLIEHCIDFLKKLNIDYIHCQAENDISKKIFLKNNFIINNIFKNITLMSCLL